MAQDKDYYEILGVDRGASEQEIKPRLSQIGEEISS